MLRLVLAAIVFLWLLAVTAVGNAVRPRRRTAASVGQCQWRSRWAPPAFSCGPVSQLPLAVLRRGFLRYTHGMGGRVLLGLLGFWYIPTSWTSLRRGYGHTRVRTVPRAGWGAAHRRAGPLVRRPTGQARRGGRAQGLAGRGPRLGRCHLCEPDLVHRRALPDLPVYFQPPSRLAGCAPRAHGEGPSMVQGGLGWRQVCAAVHRDCAGQGRCGGPAADAPAARVPVAGAAGGFGCAPGGSAPQRGGHVRPRRAAGVGRTARARPAGRLPRGHHVERPLHPGLHAGAARLDARRPPHADRRPPVRASGGHFGGLARPRSNADLRAPPWL